MSTATAVGVYDRPDEPEVTELPPEDGMVAFEFWSRTRAVPMVKPLELEAVELAS